MSKAEVEYEMENYTDSKKTDEADTATDSGKDSYVERVKAYFKKKDDNQNIDSDSESLEKKIAELKKENAELKKGLATSEELLKGLLEEKTASSTDDESKHEWSEPIYDLPDGPHTMFLYRKKDGNWCEKPVALEPTARARTGDETDISNVNVIPVHRMVKDKRIRKPTPEEELKYFG